MAAEYRDLEFWYPVLRFAKPGSRWTSSVADADDTLRSELGYPVIPDGAIRSDAECSSYDVVVVPGGAAGQALAGDERPSALVAASAASGAVVTIGTGLESPTRRAVEASKCEDADGLPR